MANKVYGIKYKNGKTLILNATWDEARLSIDGHSGVIYKGFNSYIEAELWLDNQQISHSDNTNNCLKLYTDGSFIKGKSHARWAFIVVKDDKIVHSEFGLTDLFVESRNIAGECMAAIKVLQWLDCREPAELIHDYAGIGAWLTGDWRTKKGVSQYYYDCCYNLIKDVKFVKVSGHSGNKWNDAVDVLAGLGYTTNNDS